MTTHKPLVCYTPSERKEYLASLRALVEQEDPQALAESYHPIYVTAVEKLGWRWRGDLIPPSVEELRKSLSAALKRAIHSAERLFPDPAQEGFEGCTVTLGNFARRAPGLDIELKFVVKRTRV